MHGITFNSSGNDWTMEIIIRRRNMSAIANNEYNDSHIYSQIAAYFKFCPMLLILDFAQASVVNCILYLTICICPFTSTKEKPNCNLQLPNNFKL